MPRLESALWHVLLTVKVLDLEDRCARLSSGALEFGCVDLEETQRVEMVAEDLADARLDTEDGLVGRRAQVHNTVVEASGKGDTSVLEALLLFGLESVGTQVLLTRSKSASERDASSMENGSAWASTAV